MLPSAHFSSTPATAVGNATMEPLLNAKRIKALEQEGAMREDEPIDKDPGSVGLQYIRCI